MSIDRRLYEVLEARGLSIKELSEKAELPYRTLQNYLHGLRPPSADALARICTCTGVDANWLLLGEGEMDRSRAGGGTFPRSDDDETADPYLTAEERRLSGQLLDGLNLGPSRLADLQASQRRMWKLIGVLHDEHPAGVPLDTLLSTLSERDGLSRDDVTASLSLLTAAGLIQGKGMAANPTYQLRPGLREIRFRDSHEVLAAIVTALEEISTTLLPALRERRGKLVTAMVQVPTGRGREAVQEILNDVRDRFSRLAEEPGDGDQVTVLLGLAAEGKGVLDLSVNRPRDAGEQR